MASQSRISLDELARMIDDVAGRVAAGDNEVFLGKDFSQAMKALAQMQHEGGVKLMNRIGALSNAKDSPSVLGNEYVRKRIEGHSPLDFEKDSAALRALAKEIRATAG